MASTTLKQYEVWFITGSQHLYGPKPLSRSIQIRLPLLLHLIPPLKFR